MFLNPLWCERAKQKDIEVDLLLWYDFKMWTYLYMPANIICRGLWTWKIILSITTPNDRAIIQVTLVQEHGRWISRLTNIHVMSSGTQMGGFIRFFLPILSSLLVSRCWSLLSLLLSRFTTKTLFFGGMLETYYIGGKFKFRWFFNKNFNN